jgi:hypothetical protein
VGYFFVKKAKVFATKSPKAEILFRYGAGQKFFKLF